MVTAAVIDVSSKQATARGAGRAGPPCSQRSLSTTCTWPGRSTSADCSQLAQPSVMTFPGAASESVPS